MSTVLFVYIDHMIRLLDVRKFGEPYLVLKGHRKSVSYVQYLNDKELVSAYVRSYCAIIIIIIIIIIYLKMFD